MKLFHRMQHLPLRWQLMWNFAALSIATTVIATATLETLASHRLNASLRDKAVQYARELQHQLEPVIAFDDRLTAGEVFDSLMADHDLSGLGVYAANGDLIEGRGVHPDVLPSLQTVVDGDTQHVIAVAAIDSRERKSGRIYVALTTRSIDELERRDAWSAAGIAGALTLLALLIAVNLSRGIGDRVVRIANAAERMAAGDHASPALTDTANDEIGALARSFNTMVDELNRLSIERDQLVVTERARLERLVSERTQALEQSREMFRLIAESTNAIPFTLDLVRGAFVYIGPQAVKETGLVEQAWHADGALDRMIPRAANPEIRQLLDECTDGRFEFVAPLLRASGRRAELRWTGTCELGPGTKLLRGLMLDITEMRRLARELAAAQKLESVGRLAAGVAHEINTPVQYVYDNVAFVRTAVTDIVPVVQSYRALRLAVSEPLAAGQVPPAAPAAAVAAAAAAAADADKAADLDYLLENAMPALDSSMEGLKRIATIVRSMKEFAHPDRAEKSAADLNHAIESTLTVARNEYKHVAEVETQFGELPLVSCYLGEINQVLLNLIINAAHAIADVVGDSGAKGLLTVRTRQADGRVEILVGDSGTGIPPAIRDKIFDPFFTTKEVGKGTGQGLALAHTIVVGKHGGTLRFETECGKGTTFIVSLPVAEARQAVSDQAAA